MTSASTSSVPVNKCINKNQQDANESDSNNQSSSSEAQTSSDSEEEAAEVK